jgi:DNA-binding MarR family transcriptional regulator
VSGKASRGGPSSVSGLYVTDVSDPEQNRRFEQGARPSDLAARLGITKQALNYLLGELERLDYLERQRIPTTSAPSVSR